MVVAKLYSFDYFNIKVLMLHPEARDYDSVKTRLTSAIGKLREEEVYQR